MGCSECRHMSCKGSSESPGVSSRIQEVSLDVMNIMVCLWISPVGLQRNPGGIIGCSQHRCMPGEGSSESPGVSSRIQEVSLDVTNLVVCLWTSPGGLQVSPAESSRYHCVSPTLWYVSGCLQQASRHLQQNPGWVIGFCESCGMSLDISSRSPGVSGGIQEVSLDVANIDVCLAKAPATLQVSQQNPGGIIGCREPRGMSLDVSSRSPGVSSRLQEVSLDVVNLVVHLWMSPAGLQVSPVGSRRCHWM